MKYLLLLLISFNAAASISEFFGASAHNVMLGNQMSSINDAANNYYHPSSLAFSKGNLFSYSNHVIKTNFKEINNVTTENTLSNNTTSTGSVDTNYPTATALNLHLAMQMFKKMKLGFSFYSPVTKIVSASTGDSYTPEYVMYRSRYQRLLVSLNMAYEYSKDLAFSIGITNGLKTEGETYMVAYMNTNPLPSNGKVKFEVKPTIGLILSMAKKINQKDLFLLTFHQEIKSEFENKAYGKTPMVGGSGELPFNINMNSMLFYDPHMLRSTYIKNINSSLELVSTLEFQLWTGYELPRLNYDSISGFQSTRIYGDYDFRNILIPKVGIKYKADEVMTYSLGAFYRQSPIETNLNEESNMIDPDVLAVTVGFNRKITLMEQKMNLGVAYQLHHLFGETVEKSSLMENGQAGDKIGSPGYDTGGNVHVVSFGLNWSI